MDERAGVMVPDKVPRNASQPPADSNEATAAALCFKRPERAYIAFDRSCLDERAEGNHPQRLRFHIVRRRGEQALQRLPNAELFKVWLFELTRLLGRSLSDRHLMGTWRELPFALSMFSTSLEYGRMGARMSDAERKKHSCA